MAEKDFRKKNFDFIICPRPAANAAGRGRFFPSDTVLPTCYHGVGTPST